MTRERRMQRGIAAIETLLAAPVVLLLGLSAFQWALVFHGYQAVSQAAIDGARAGSVDHASNAAVAAGIARGLAPWVFGATGPEDFVANQVRMQHHLEQGRAAGWADWRRIAPTRESFDDWAELARDSNGDPIAGLLEIPNDNLTVRTNALLPTSGIAGYRGIEPIGNASGQTLADANLLKIEFVYGIPLTVPLIGRFAAWVMASIDGCPSAVAAATAIQSTPATESTLRLGTIDFGAQPGPANPRAWACAHYRATDDGGRPRPRWPVRVSATIRMQSPARDADAGGSRDEGSFTGEVLGAGTVDGAKAFEPIPVERINPLGAGPTKDGSVDRAPGFLKIGADRLIEPPGQCVAP